MDFTNAPELLPEEKILPIAGYYDLPLYPRVHFKCKLLMHAR